MSPNPNIGPCTAVQFCTGFGPKESLCELMFELEMWDYFDSYSSSNDLFDNDGNLCGEPVPRLDEMDPSARPLVAVDPPPRPSDRA